MVFAAQEAQIARASDRPHQFGFYTIEQNGRVLYDSRTDVPCDMVEWERSHERNKARWEREKAEYATRYAGKGIRTGHERPEFDE